MITCFKCDENIMSIPECYYPFFGSDESLSVCKCSSSTFPSLCQCSNSFLDLDNIKSKPSFLFQPRLVSNKENNNHTDFDHLNYKPDKHTGAFMTAAISSFKKRVQPGRATTNLSFEKSKREHIGDTNTGTQLIQDSQHLFRSALKEDVSVSCLLSSMSELNNTFEETIPENENGTFSSLTTPKEKQETLHKKNRNPDTTSRKGKHNKKRGKKQTRQYKSRERKQLNRIYKPNVAPEFNSSVQTTASNQKVAEIDITLTNSDQLSVVADIILGALNQNLKSPQKDDQLSPSPLHIDKIKPLKQLDTPEYKHSSKRRQSHPRTSPSPNRIDPYLSTKKIKPFSLRDSFQKRFSRKDKHFYYPFTEHSIKKKSKLISPCYSVQLCLDRLASFYQKEWQKRLGTKILSNSYKIQQVLFHLSKFSTCKRKKKNKILTMHRFLKWLQYFRSQGLLFRATS
uniref:Uncharacterized protein n=1 Tax=Cacopsylla melanoneura TaxID=428564 RepID=A0A8D9BCZ0_9HEMI